MRILFFVLSLVLFACPRCWAMEDGYRAKVDSMERLLPSLADTARLQALQDLVKISYQREDEKGYRERLYDEACRQGNTYMQAYVWAKRVEELYADFQSDSIFKVAAEAEAFTRKYKEYKYLATIQQIVAKRYIDQKSYALGLAKMQQMYREAMERSDYMALARASSIIAEAYEGMGILDEVKEYLEESSRWLGMANQPFSFLYTENYIRMATVCLNLEEYDQVLLYADSLELKMHEIARENREDFSAERYLTAYYRGMASIRLGQYDRARQHIRQAEERLGEAWPEYFTQLLNELYFSYYYQTGDYRRAYDYNERVLHFYASNQLDMAVQRYERKGNVLSRMGDLRGAVDAYQTYAEKNKEVNLTTFKYQINEMRTLYDLEKVEMLAEQDRQRLAAARRLTMALTAGLLLLGCVVVLIAVNRHRLRIKNRQLFRQLEEKDRLLAREALFRPEETRHDGADDAPETVGQTPGEGLFDRLDRLMKEKQLYTQPEINRRSLSAELSTNEKYLYQAVRERTGLGFNDYINTLRLEHARKLLYLHAADITIEEASDAAGFGSRKTLTRLFRDTYAMTPSEFRRIAQEKKKGV